MNIVSLKDLMKPKRIEVEDSASDSRYGRFIAEPLERGFGITIGNALRRILLSSLQGSAITAVQVEGVMHEFSTVPGVVEDLTEIVLNLKEVVTRLEDKEEAHVRIEATGPCRVTAGMIQGDPSVTVISPNALICTLAEGHSLKMNITVRVGRGYVSSERNRVEGVPVGTVFIDSAFSPVRRVNHTITQARVGQRTDYDKLSMEIWTDGSIDARSAVAQAAHILHDQLSLFIGDGLVLEKEEPKVEEPKRKLDAHLFRRIDEIELSVRSANCLENADIKFIGELVQRSEPEMLRTKNFGRKEILSGMGLHLGMKIEGFPVRTELEKHRESPEA